MQMFIFEMDYLGTQRPACGLNELLNTLWSKHFTLSQFTGLLLEPFKRLASNLLHYFINRK